MKTFVRIAPFLLGTVGLLETAAAGCVFAAPSPKWTDYISAATSFAYGAAYLCIAVTGYRNNRAERKRNVFLSLQD